MSFDFELYKTLGVKINYYYICKRKLWLFSKGISFENYNERVLQGKIVHENSYKREKNKEIEIDGNIKLDIIDKNFVREVKISSKMEKSDRMQLLYYLYYLKSIGINRKGKINYVKEKRVDEIELTDNDSKEIEKALIEIKEIESLKKAPLKIDKAFCRKCSYYEFCYIVEE
ncbi:CRISPR-associated protein Cas4 [Clostridium septicum]|uniref:CRISPR-associated exonuclease Cas4 n=1 Tax=Clostridium septicum TaxID=1504 RepID=A0ABY5AXJ5_CLOSE|nr:CRISPR-associated protein Cas4 [Clostridium septicum]MDU1313014.1 CRISPR-associated protein Cas4 [Clostridium septicum]UEC22142.1 CRISPR-associated protein Cas4 [Clostridium septicum]USR99828.1 CRISPR-associated protein Cas4 [Clostridium septicum]WLF68348.1 CRISPR-associated protein Cas4 [Clostridium septicum]